MDGDWRLHLRPEGRQRIINKITDAILGCVPVGPVHDLTEIQRIAARFEERMYASATSLCDYLRRISLKLLAMTHLRPESFDADGDSSLVDG